MIFFANSGFWNERSYLLNNVAKPIQSHACIALTQAWRALGAEAPCTEIEKSHRLWILYSPNYHAHRKVYWSVYQHLEPIRHTI